jgi:hypothetical protein
VHENLGHRGSDIPFVEVNDRKASVHDRAALEIGDGGPLAVVEHPFREIGGARAPNETVLVGDADRAEAVALEDDPGGGVHLHLLEHLRSRQVLRGVPAPMKNGSFSFKPFQVIPGGAVGHERHLREQVGLVQELDGHPYRGELFGAHDGIEHPHATGVHLSEEPLSLQDVLGEPFTEPLHEPLHELGVTDERVGPQSRMRDAKPFKGGRVVEEGHESRPRAVEVAEEEYRAPVALEGRGDVARPHPGGEHNDDGRVRVDAGQDRAPLGLGGDEAVLLGSFKGIGPVRTRSRDPKIAIGDEPYDTHSTASVIFSS